MVELLLPVAIFPVVFWRRRNPNMFHFLGSSLLVFPIVDALSFASGGSGLFGLRRPFFVIETLRRMAIPDLLPPALNSLFLISLSFESVLESVFTLEVDVLIED